MYQFDMTDDEVREAKWASREVAKHLDGIKLIEGLRIGAVLMKGRQHAMTAAGSNKPQGKAYAEAFREWKTAFKFREGKDAENYYDVAIVCAQHRTIADEIVALLSPKQRSDMGMFGLAKRVRAKVNELEGVPKPVKIRPNTVRGDLDGLRGELADLRERLTASEPKGAVELLELLARHEPAEVLEIMRLHQRSWFTRLIALVDEGVVHERDRLLELIKEVERKERRERKSKEANSTGEPLSGRRLRRKELAHGRKADEEAGGYAPGVAEHIAGEGMT
jgi:hypothetical protein